MIRTCLPRPAKESNLHSCQVLGHGLNGAEKDIEAAYFRHLQKVSTKYLKCIDILVGCVSFPKKRQNTAFWDRAFKISGDVV